MALERDILRPGPTTVPVGQVTAEDRITQDIDDDADGRSNVMAFLLGGVVIAGGLLAFLYYDSDNMASRDITTGSIPRFEQSTPAPGTGLSGLPLQPKPSGATP